MSIVSTMSALIRREFLEGKNGFFWTPIILSAVVIFFVILGALGLGGIHIASEEFAAWNGADGELSFGEALAFGLEKGQEEPGALPFAVTGFYWTLSGIAQIALPFVIVFSLLGALYEERRDKSILFWKSMPVSDWQEVLAKLVMSTLGVMLVYTAVAISAMIVTGIILSLISLVQGGPVTVLWPISYMVASWGIVLFSSVIWLLWMLPIAAWLLFVSAYARRLPFMFAFVPPAFLIALEGMFFETASLARWIGEHLGGWILIHDVYPSIEPENATHLARMIAQGSTIDALMTSLSSGSFWMGLVLAGGLFWGAVELRKRAV